jgi:hypothetical protein
MNTPLKMPAYAGALRKLRRAGNHPACVHLIYGHNWRAPTCCFLGRMFAPGLHFTVAVSPAEYEPGLFDFRAVLGLPVAVFDQVRAVDEFKDADARHAVPHGFGPFYTMLGEVARCAAEVEVHSPQWAVPQSANDMAFAMRAGVGRADAERNHGWPAWWSQEIEDLNAARRQQWIAAVTAEGGDAGALRSA